MKYVKSIMMSHQPKVQKLICQHENRPFQCDSCGVRDFETHVNADVVWNFVDVVEKLGLTYDIVCDTCRYKILYEFYRDKVERSKNL